MKQQNQSEPKNKDKNQNQKTPNIIYKNPSHFKTYKNLTELSSISPNFTKLSNNDEMLNKISQQYDLCKKEYNFYVDLYDKQVLKLVKITKEQRKSLFPDAAFNQCQIQIDTLRKQIENTDQWIEYFVKRAKGIYEMAEESFKGIAIEKEGKFEGSKKIKIEPKLEREEEGEENNEDSAKKYKKVPIIKIDRKSVKICPATLSNKNSEKASENLQNQQSRKRNMMLSTD